MAGALVSGAVRRHPTSTLCVRAITSTRADLVTSGLLTLLRWMISGHLRRSMRCNEVGIAGGVMGSLSRHVLLCFKILGSGVEVLFIRFVTYEIQDVSYATVYRRFLEGLAYLFGLPLRHNSYGRDSTHASFLRQVYSDVDTPGDGLAIKDPECLWTLWGPSEPWGGMWDRRAGVGAYDEGDATNRQSPPLGKMTYDSRRHAVRRTGQRSNWLRS